MNETQENYTRKWWEAVCSDEERLKKFLIKLHRTEYEGFEDNLGIVRKWCDPDPTKDKLAKRILYATADDEMRHSQLLFKIITARGWEIPNKEEIPVSDYWEYMERATIDLQTACAVCYYGEKLASDKFAIMLSMECTPDDVKSFLIEALPDETYHARSFEFLAGEEAIATIGKFHSEIVTKMTKGEL